jgi:hypothetical protein
MLTFLNYLILLYIHTTLITAQLLPFLTGRTDLPILQDPTFNLRPAELILQSQLRAYGVNINLDLDVDIKLDLLGLDLLKRGKRSRKERSLLGLNLNLGLGGSGKSDGAGSGLKLDLGMGDATKLDINAGIAGVNLNVNTTDQKGQGDNARGERGGTAVRPCFCINRISFMLTCSGTPTSPLVIPHKLYPLSRIPVQPIYSSTPRPVQTVTSPTTLPSIPENLVHTNTSRTPGRSIITMNQEQRDRLEKIQSTLELLG